MARTYTTSFVWEPSTLTVTAFCGITRTLCVNCEVLHTLCMREMRWRCERDVIKVIGQNMIKYGITEWFFAFHLMRLSFMANALCLTKLFLCFALFFFNLSEMVFHFLFSCRSRSFYIDSVTYQTHRFQKVYRKIFGTSSKASFRSLVSQRDIF